MPCFVDVAVLFCFVFVHPMDSNHFSLFLKLKIFKNLSSKYVSKKLAPLYKDDLEGHRLHPTTLTFPSPESVFT